MVQNVINDEIFNLSESEITVLTEISKKVRKFTPKGLIDLLLNHYTTIDNPVLPIALVTAMWCKKNPHIIPIAEEIVKSRLYESGKRVPFLNNKYWLYFDVKGKNLLNDEEFQMLYTAIKLGYKWPGLAGSPLDEYAYKEAEYESSEDLCNIITNQISLKKGEINKEYLITQTKGGLSIDLGIGCPMGCKYCYRVVDCTEQYTKQWEPAFSITPQEAVKRLLGHPWFTPNISPLGIMMSTTEAFLPKMLPITTELLVRLDDLGITNRVTIITKSIISQDTLWFLNDLKNLDVDLCICYSNLPTSVEPTSSSSRLAALTNSREFKHLNIIGYYRPIIEGYNTSEDQIHETLSSFKASGIKTIVYGGVRISQDHINNFKDNNLPLPNEFRLGDKYLSVSTEKRLLRAFDEIFGKDSDATFLRRSSCGRTVARGSNIPDYNCHYFYRETLKGCIPKCAFHSMCTRFIKPTDQQLKSLLTRLNRSKAKFVITEEGVFILEKLTVYERTFLVQNLMAPVFC